MAEIATLEHYIKLVDDALFDIQDMRSAIEFDEDYMMASAQFVGPLAKDLEQLKKELLEDSHQFGGQDLPYMQYLKKLPEEVVPFKYLLKVINEVHKNARFE